MPFPSGPPFVTPPVAARNELLDAARINQMVKNHLDTRGLILIGHNYNGTHNELEVARGVGNITESGGTPAVQSGSSALFTAVSGFTSGGTTGIATITIDSALLGGQNYCIRATPNDTGVELLPHMCTVEQVSATQVKVYCWKLASLAGNSWSLTDFDFSIAVHAQKYGLVGTAWSTPVGVEDENGLIPNDVNRHTEGVAGQYRYAKVGHSTAGAHIIREVARAWGSVLFDSAGPSYSKGAGSANLSSTVTRSSIGNVVINFSTPLTGPTQTFHWEGYDRGAGDIADFVIVNFAPSATSGSVTQLNVYIYKYNSGANTWAFADADFSFQTHSA